MGLSGRGGVLAWSLVAVIAACSSFDSAGGGDPGAGDAGAEGSAVPPGPPAPPPAPADDAGDAGACADPMPTQEDFAELGTAAKNLFATTTTLYWLAAGQIQRRSLAGGATDIVWDPAKVPGETPPTVFVVAGAYVVANMSGVKAIPDQVDSGIAAGMGSVVPPLATNGAKIFAVNPPANYGIGTPPSNVGVLGALPSAPVAIAANTTDVAYALAAPSPGAANAVYSLVQGTPAVIFEAADRSPSHLAVDGTEIFMTDKDTGDVFKTPLTGGNAVTVLAKGRKGLGDVAVRMKVVYYATSNGLRSVPAEGGCERVLTDVATDTFAVSDNHIYYASGTKIRRAPLPQ